MIKVTVLYPYQEKSRFDPDYYVSKHLELAKSLMGDALKGYLIETGLTGTLLQDDPADNVLHGEPPPFRIIGHLFFDTVGDYKRAFLPAIETLMADTAAYTDIISVVQISEVVCYRLPQSFPPQVNTGRLAHGDQRSPHDHDIL
jgi:uncharacterized protein (TIGR02118 family)